MRGARRCAAGLALGAASAQAGGYHEWEALVLAHYARLVFCDPDALESWSCGEPCASAARPSRVRVIGPGATSQEQGLVALLPTDGSSTSAARECIVAFRGSVTTRNWITDIHASMVPWPPEGEWCADCYVHKGFAAAYAEMRPKMVSAIAELGCTHLKATGHSLGGAIATLATMELRSNLNISTDPLITFGSPRVGDGAFAESFRSAFRGLEAPSWRVVHHHDPVPHLAPRVSVNGRKYTHIPREVWYDLGSDSYRVCDGSGEDPSCSSSVSFLEIVNLQHLKYLNLSFQHTELPDQCARPRPEVHLI